MIDLYIFSSALRDSLRLKRVVVWILIAIGIFALAQGWTSTGNYETREIVYGQISSSLVFRVVALASALFTTSIISQEVEGKTIAYLLTRPVERWRLLLGRYLASVVAVVIIGLICAAAASFGVYGSKGLGYTTFWNDAKAILFAAFAYGSLFLLISLLVNRAMIVCLLYAFGWETVTPNMPGESGFLSIISYVEAIAQHPLPQSTDNPMAFLARSLGLNTIASGTGIAVLTLLSVVLLGLSLAWFTQFEYVPREDAE